MDEIIHTLPDPEGLALAEIQHQQSESEADEILWREHMAKLKRYGSQPR